MNQNPGEHWRGSGGPPQNEAQQSGRPYGGFVQNGPSPPSHVLPPPPPSGYHHQQQQQQQQQTPSGHSLSIADLTQGPPPPPQHQYNTQPPPSNQSHQMSSMSNPMPHQSPQYLGQDREVRDFRARDHEMREREMREREQRERGPLGLQRHQEEMMMREREARERDRLRNEQPPQQAPVQSHAGSIPIHQPVASKIQTSIHGPNGLLANGGSGTQQSGPGNPQGAIFGLPLQHEQQRPSFAHQQSGAPSQPAQFLGQASPMPAQAQVAHGQQPILNDALSYLDQVKVRFSDQPDVYNKFLDIMKDFKSQAIDTPGVIQRVSDLFSGHPALIQGFNTFLPPGYRIECGTEENPDAIRVTTPSGTMTQSLQARSTRINYDALPASQPGLNRQDTVESTPRWTHQISPNARNARLPGFEQAGTNPERLSEHESLVQQQEQRDPSQVQGVTSATTAAQNRSAMAVSPGPGQASIFGQANGLFGGEMKRSGGPVEFNHAINYVNKIKNRFAQQPEVYKQFLEILQTYQREQKPIQDVYTQVTLLFTTAPDLLEDFKQFLPDNAATAKMQATARAQAAEETSNVRGEPGYGSGQIPQAQTPRPAAKMPPMGQFDPPSTSKEHKKRRAGQGPAATTQPQAQIPEPSSKGGIPVTNANKRQKLSTQRPTQVDTVPISPKLIPALPEPLPPHPSVTTTNEEMGFFDRSKKLIANRTMYAEFLKLINLYTQDLIDKNTLADRVEAFIGSSEDLMNYFRTFLGIEDEQTMLQPHAIDPGRVNLSHCRAFGPSYRHLPKRDQTKTCKGRDGMCYEVLNDVWASHPTWASEDSGFVAHRKNQYEEALHRIEEERHDYDFHIESCQRTIQLMEPIVQQISVMDEQDRVHFRLARGLGGASEAIPKRVILKVYGREVGNRVLEDMYAKPTAVLPIVLSRLKQKLEEWKQVQREWEKVWRDQINKQFWKSLDHQGINAKNLDKKNFQQKTLTSEIQAKYEERKRNRDAGMQTKKHQLEYQFKDPNVLADVTSLILWGLESEKNALGSSEQAGLKSWLYDFVCRFFGLERTDFHEQVEAAMRKLPLFNDDCEKDRESDTPLPAANRSKAPHKSADWLRRAALERRNGKEDSVASASKESTPAPGMSEMDVDEEVPVDTTREQSERRWINVKHSDQSARQMAMDDPYEHFTFNLYANANIYCFFRLFETLYSRLLAIKQFESSVVEDVNRWKGSNGKKKPALQLNMVDKQPDDFFKDVSGSRPYYGQVLEMCAEVLFGRIELAHLEETLRRFYNKSGWQLYTIDKLVAAILRFIMNILGGDTKDKSVEIANIFFRDREKPDTTRKQEIQYRKQVEKLSKGGEVYRISYTPSEKSCTVRLFPSDEATFDSDQLTEDARWQYYVASYTMTDATEGVDLSRMRPSYLRRSIPPQNADIETAYEEVYGNLDHLDDQSAFISPETYKLHLSDSFIFSRRDVKAVKSYEAGKIEESEKFREKFVRNAAWMKDKAVHIVDRRKEAWEKGVKEGMMQFNKWSGNSPLEKDMEG